jgi:LmbE family N-acetylglucosaminyl deacetylase
MRWPTPRFATPPPAAVAAACAALAAAQPYAAPSAAQPYAAAASAAQPYAAPASAAQPYAAPASAALPHIDAGTTLLVVAPHPDDETLCCAGVIQRVARAGGRVSVVWITSGDAERMGLLLNDRVLFASRARARQFGARRMAEARAATALLGVPPGGQLFLGYPDGDVLELLDGNPTTLRRSGTTGATRVPYADALFPAHPYSGASLERDFAAVLERVRPTLILAPSLEDSHPDHRAAGLLTISAIRRGLTTAQVRFWIVHGGEGWPSPRELLAGVPLTPAPLSRGLDPAVFPLEPAEEDTEVAALEAYRTQMLLMAPFLLAFVRTNELFSTLAQAPPHRF